MNRKPLDLILIASATAITISIILFKFNAGPVGVLLGLPFVLFYPGYVLAEVLMPERARNVPERLLFSVGLSVVVVVLGGLILNLLPDGLQSGTWALLLGGIIIAECAWVSRRRYRVISREDEQGVRWAATAWQLCFAVIIVLIVEGSLAFTIYGATNQPHPGFTQLWILPGTAGRSNDTVRFGIKSMEMATTSYNLTITENGKVIHQEDRITLNPDQAWESSITIPAPSAKLPIKIFLYRTQDPNTAYRTVLLWVGGSR